MAGSAAAMPRPISGETSWKGLKKVVHANVAVKSLSGPSMKAVGKQMLGMKDAARNAQLRRASSTGNIEGAASAAFQLLQADGKLQELTKAQTLAEEGQDALARGKFADALRLAEEALQKDQANIKALRVACKVHLKKKMWREALRETRLLTSTDNPHESDFTDRAVAKIGARDFDGAISDCNEALKINRIYVRAMYERGRAKYYKFDFYGCIDECKECIRIDSREPAYWSLRAMAKQGLYDNSGAIDDCNEAIRNDYKHATAWSTRGDARNDQCDHIGAVKDCTIALKLEKTDARVFSNRADAYESLAKYEEAIEDATQAFKLDPHLYDALGRRGEARFGIGDLNGAIEDCEAAVRLNDLDKDAWCCTGKAKFLKGDYAGARKAAQGGIRIDPEYDECYNIVHKADQADRVLSAWNIPLIEKSRQEVLEREQRLLRGSQIELIRVGEVDESYYRDSPLALTEGDGASSTNASGR